MPSRPERRADNGRPGAWHARRRETRGGGGGLPRPVRAHDRQDWKSDKMNLTGRWRRAFRLNEIKHASGVMRCSAHLVLRAITFASVQMCPVQSTVARVEV